MALTSITSAAAFSVGSLSGPSHNECRRTVANQKVVGSNPVCRATRFSFEPKRFRVDAVVTQLSRKWPFLAEPALCREGRRQKYRRVVPRLHPFLTFSNSGRRFG
jgi:hypothetical protein